MNEPQMKLFQMTYPEFAMLIALVSSMVGTDADVDGRYTRLYARLRGGSA